MQKNLHKIDATLPDNYNLYGACFYAVHYSAYTVAIKWIKDLSGRSMDIQAPQIVFRQVQGKFSHPTLSLMRLKAIFSSLTLLFALNLIGQTRTIRGKVIDENFYPIHQAKIFNGDTLL
jgi:hypothetical protein